MTTVADRFRPTTFGECVPNYNVMAGEGRADASTRYLAFDLVQRNVLVMRLAPGPLTRFGARRLNMGRCQHHAGAPPSTNVGRARLATALLSCARRFGHHSDIHVTAANIMAYTTSEVRVRIQK